MLRCDAIAHNTPPQLLPWLIQNGAHLARRSVSNVMPPWLIRTEEQLARGSLRKGATPPHKMGQSLLGRGLASGTTLPHKVGQSMLGGVSLARNTSFQSYKALCRTLNPTLSYIFHKNNNLILRFTLYSLHHEYR
jgi:hypothetical protein